MFFTLTAIFISGCFAVIIHTESPLTAFLREPTPLNQSRVSGTINCQLNVRAFAAAGCIYRSQVNAIPLMDIGNH